MNTARLAEAVVFVWLGMVLAISFMEAPLKFHVPGVSVQIALSIGRVVFVALNACELVLAVVLAYLAYSHDTPLSVDVGSGVAIGVLLIQVLLVRPVLARRSDEVLAGADSPRSGGHYVYVGLEVVKVGALLSTGVLLLGR